MGSGLPHHGRLGWYPLDPPAGEGAERREAGVGGA
jgi:hypothetical protein